MRSRRFSSKPPLRPLIALAFAAVLWAETPMVRIPAGSFERGRTHALPDDGLKWVPVLVMDDRPVRTIHLDAFDIDEHEVTNQDYAAFVKATGHRAPYNWPGGVVPAGKDQIPVVNVSWDDAAAYAKWAGKRLPTEAEWERVCRGPVDGKRYPWGDEEPKDRARFNVIDGPGKVCQFAKTGFGVHDIVGNVWEWTADFYGRDYYAVAPDRNPPGPESGMYRVLRGGSWADEPKYLTCAHRMWARPAERSPNIGFRCARSVVR